MSSIQPPKATSRPHIYAIDYVRISGVVMVIINHVIGQVPTVFVIGAIGALTHIGREIFIFISALVLVYSYGRRADLQWSRFFKRRYLLVGVPYVAWTLIYTLATGHALLPLGQGLVTVAQFLLSGRAQYHLYYLLVTMQLYLLFPWLRWLLRVTQRHHVLLIIMSGILQLVVATIIEFSLGQTTPLAFWLINPDPWIMSYQFYILMGGVVAWHLPAVLDYLENHFRQVCLAALGAALLAQLVFVLQVHAGMSVTAASTTFQPVIVVESMAAVALLLALGQRWQHRGLRGRRLALKVSDASFGLYLAHPLVLQAVIGVLSVAGFAAVVTAAPSLVTVVLLLLVGAPLVALVTFVAVEALRLTPISLLLTGRPRYRAKAAAPLSPRM